MRNQGFKAFLRKRPYLITIGMSAIAILAAFFISGILIALIGIDPFKAYRYFFEGVFGNVYGFGETMNKFTPLLCCAMSFSIAGQSGFFNLGSEGQFLAGGLFASIVATCMPESLGVVAIILSILAGILGGALLSSFSGLLRMVFNANELLSTMMLNYIMQYVIILLVNGVMKNPNSNMEQTVPVAEAARLPIILQGSRLHAGIIIALMALLLVWFLQQRTVLGFEMRVSGINRQAALYAGVKERRSLIIVIILCGALAGLGGSLELLGNQYKLMEGFSNGYGFDGIGISVMGQHTPLGIILATVLFSAFRTGTASMQRGISVPTPILYILQGVIVISVIVSNYFVRKIKATVFEGRA